MTYSNICLIPARAGSKRLPGKNTLFLERVIQTAKASKCFDSIVVSTNCPKCTQIAKEQGVQIHQRKPSCARDDSTLEQFLQTFIKEEHAAARYWQTITLILATAALLTKEDIQAIIKQHQENKPAITMAVTKLFHPIGHVFCDNRTTLLISPEKYHTDNTLMVDNGSIYVIDPKSFLKNKSFYIGLATVTMPKYRSIDLDDKEDLIIMEALLNN